MTTSLNVEPLGLPVPPAGRPLIVAGPCSAESEDQVRRTAAALAAQGIRIFRAGLWKPRTRPHQFEGVGETGLPWLARVRVETGMLVATEVASAAHVAAVRAHGLDLAGSAPAPRPAPSPCRNWPRPWRAATCRSWSRTR